jgi:hypothetical protein
MVFFQDAANPGKNLGGKMDNNIFEAQSAWYIDLLRSKKVEKKDIPLGYYIEIDGNSIRDIAGINVCLWPKTKAVQYYFLTRTDSREIDTVPKCPPDCFESRIVGQGIAFTRYSDNDSVPKCPPACNQIIIRQEIAQSRYVQDGKFELLRERTMRTIIDNSYNKQTYALTKQD